MKKVLWGVVGLVVVLVAAVLIVPNFINWNEYKGVITDRAKAATGRLLEIRGDIKMAVLPAPAVQVEDVRIANIEGGSTPDMASLKRLEVRVALAPLLRGQVQVQSIKVVEPTVNIDILKDGRNNLVFQPPQGSAKAPSPSAGGPSAGSGGANGSSIRIDDLVVEKGTIVYRDARSGETERVTNLNGRFAAASLTGPMEASGSAVVRDIPLSFEATVGAIVQGRTVPLNADVAVIPGDVKTHLSGAVTGLSDAPRFKGKLSVEGKNLGDFVAAVAKGAALPPALRRSFGFSADIQADKGAAEVSGIIASLAQTQGTGKVAVAFGKELRADVDMSINRVDLDSLLKPIPAPAKASPAPGGKPAALSGDGQPKATAALPPRRAARSGGGSGLADFRFPQGVNANLNLMVEALTYRGEPIRQAKLSASLTNGELTLSQLSALFPGGSDIAVFGFATADKKGPKFDGSVEITSNDLRSVIKWLGLPALNVPAERLRKLKLAGKVVASPTDVRVNDINLRLDSTTVKGAATIAVRQRPAFGANLIVDRINVDGYLPPAKPATRTAPAASGAASGNPAAPGGGQDPLAGLSALADFDANLKAHVNALTVHGLPARNVSLDATLLGGDITIRRFGIADMAGVGLGVAGGIEGFARKDGAVRPALKDLRLRLDAKSLDRFAKLSGLKLPVSPAQLGAVGVTARLDGDLQKLKTAATVKAAGGAFDLAGTLAPLAQSPTIDAKVALKHPSFVRLLRLAGLAYRPAKSNFGGIDVTGRLRGGLDRVTFSDFKSTVGPLKAAGNIVAELAGARPKITADLQTGVIPVDDFLPAQRRAEITPPDAPRLVPIAWRPLARDGNLGGWIHRIAQRIDGRWSTAPLDLSVLRTFNADLNLKSAAITFDKLRLDNPVVVANLEGGVLQTRQLTATVYGGALTGNARVAENGRHSQYQSRLNLKNLNVAQAVRAAGAGSVGSGRMTAAVDLTSAGGSVADIVSALNGAGSFSLAGLDVRGASRGSALAPILDLVSGLNQFAGGFSGQGGKGLANAEGSFRVGKGIASFSDLRISSNVGNGNAQGTVDLPNWRIDSKGTINLAQNLLVQLLAQKTNAPQSLPFSVSGRLDAPNVKLETASLPNRGLPIPQKLLNKPGIGQVLQGILGGGQQPAQQAPQSGSTAPGAKPPPPPQEEQQQNKKTKVEDVLKGILRGLGR